ncbi:MAG: phosphotransferase [Pseudomonadota bacterium]
MTKANDQKDARAAFLENAGWGAAAAEALAGDASTRSYQRLRMGGENAVLMIAPPASEAPSCPPEADEAERRALGYNAMARLAGPNLNAFVALSSALRDAGLSAPTVYAADQVAGLALLEDLGDDLFARIIGKVKEETLYCAGVDALVTLHAGAPFPPASASYTMLDYDALAMEAEAQLFMEWYWPLKKGEAASEDLLTEYSGLWRDTLGGLSAPHTFVLRDFHAENLLWLPDRNGVERVGVIDFQDALFGHAAYDLVSLLEDARRDVDEDTAARMIEYYLSRSGADPDAFLRDYAILAGQRNAKILGIFARLARRDKKPRYLDLLPRVEAHFRRDLQREELAVFRAFFAKHLPELVS